MMDEESKIPRDEGAQSSAANAAPQVEESPAQADAATALLAEVEELRDRYLRTAAELENLRKRAEREVADARAYGIALFARDVISVADNLTRALEAIEPAAREAAAGTLKALLEGVELTDRELHKALQKHGIRPINPIGEKFDPNFHQAMLELADPAVPTGNVVQVLQVGYAIGDRILRPALVAVAKAAANSAPGEDHSETDGQSGSPD
jgi:molecular chaperone GrpE